jgi:hypothetical protein
MDVTVAVGDGKVRAELDTGQNSGEAPLEFDKLRMKTIGVFVERLVNAEMRREELETLGEHLYVGLLTSTVRDFVEAQLAAATTSNRVQLRLKLPHAGEGGQDSGDGYLASLPWEYLYCPGIKGANPFFVSQRATLVLSRYMPLGGYPNEEKPAAQGALRIGLVVANPHDDELPPIAGGDVVAAVEELGERDDVKVDVLNDPTPSNIQEWLEAFRPQVMHFIGHGGFDHGEKFAKIVLLDDIGESRDVADYELGNFFAATHTPTVVVLHLPQRGPDDVEPNMARVAPALIQAGVPAVVAMQHPFPVEAARCFIAAFYTALADEEPIDDAVMRGRQNYLTRVPGSWDNRAFGTPALYARAYSSVIKRPISSGQEEETPELPGPELKPQAPGRRAAPRRRAAAATGDLPNAPELGDAASTGGNGKPAERSPELEGLVRAVRHAGREAMDVVDLSPIQKAKVYGWFRTLDNEFVGEANADELANYVRYEWTEPEEDAQLRQVAEAMEQTARREAQ